MVKPWLAVSYQFAKSANFYLDLICRNCISSSIDDFAQRIFDRLHFKLKFRL